MKLLIKGIPASGGIAKGRARVILPGSNGKLKPGEILVAYITDASMFVEIMAHAKAIVTDQGGITSHPAIVSRELGIPCVVATQKATKIIKSGMRIIVDGKKGVVCEQD